MLGGPDGQTLFLMLAEWAGVENAQEQIAKRTGEVRMVHVDVPHARPSLAEVDASTHGACLSLNCGFYLLDHRQTATALAGLSVYT